MTPAEFAQASARALRHVIRRNVLHFVEPTKGPWTNQNFFGDQRTQPLPVTEGITVEVLPKNSRLYGPPHVHSINLGRSDEVLAGNADVYAEVTYGCGGIENSFLCDWVHGLQFALVCNSLHINAVSYRPIEVLPYDASGTGVFLGAMVAKGDVSRGAPVTFTQSQVQLANSGAPGNSVAFPFPDFAREFTAHVHVAGGPTNGNSDPSVATGVTLELLNEGGQVMAFYDAQVCAGGRKVPIPGGANKLLVTNTNVGGQCPCTVEWFLGF